MMSTPAPGHRFAELQRLLSAYATFGFTFTDTPQETGPALRSFLRVSVLDPDRAAQTAAQIRDLLAVGLFADEIAGEVALMPQIVPSEERTVEECLRIAADHIESWLSSLAEPVGTPENAWEWRQMFPELHYFLGAYYHQDCLDEHASYAEIVSEYITENPVDSQLAMVREMRNLLTRPDSTVSEATQAFGLAVYTPHGETLRQWLNDLADIVEQCQYR